MKNHTQKSSSLVLAASFALSTALVACDGSNAKMNSESYLRSACGNASAFNFARLNEQRQKSLTADKSATSPNRALVMRTFLRKDVTTGPVKVASLDSTKELASERSVVSAVASSDDVVVTTDCKTLTATYTGPGASVPVQGKIVGLSINSISIEQLDKITGVKTHVMVEQKSFRPVGKTKVARAKTAQQTANGFGPLVITVTRHQGALQSVREWVQEYSEKSLAINLHPSALADAVTLALAKNANEAVKLSAVQKYQEAVSRKSQLVQAEFADVVALRDFVAPAPLAEVVAKNK